jgi:tryptophan 2,3-dioxygenase
MSIALSGSLLKNALRAVSTMPYILACGHRVAQQEQAHYCDYLHLDDLLALQPAAEQLGHPDEHLFITVHQSTEIWFKQILFELPRCIDALDADNVGLAIWLLRRINRIVALLLPTLHLLDTMAASDFFAFRAGLAPASGAESQQFHEIVLLIGQRDPAYRQRLEHPAGDHHATSQLWTKRLDTAWNSRSLKAALHDLFERREITPDRLYVVAPQPNPSFELFLLVEELLDLDQAMMLWRSTHVRIAERAIGPVLPGTGSSSGVSHLEATASSRQLFPELWQLRTQLWEQRAFTPQQAPNEHSPSYPVTSSSPVAT